MCIEILCCTDTGQVREQNEDYVGGDESLGIVVLADGMGGYQAGEVASETAVKTVIEHLHAPVQNLNPMKLRTNHRYHSATVRLEQAILKANQVIYDKAEEETQYRGMGTTVVAVWFHNHLLSIAHVGDSRLYRLRGKEFSPLTKDHSVRQELIDCGFYTAEQARTSPNKNLVTRALGVAEKVNVEIQEEKVLAQDIYLLCSDGLSDMVDDETMQSIISNAKTLEQAAQFLIDAANEKGGKDNISLILVRPLGIIEQPKKSWWKRLFGNPFNSSNTAVRIGIAH
jgi:serine/threonine protein phosphatase PrpC